MTSEKIAHIMSLVVHYAQQYHNHMTMPQTTISPAFDAARAAVEAALRDAPQAEPVAAQHRFRHPQKGTPDWSVWQPCAVSNRPAWEIDSQGYEVEYRALCVLAARPSAPTAVEPDERAEFEAWIAKDGGDLSMFGSPPHKHYKNRAVMGAWEAWQARASKGTK